MFRSSHVFAVIALAVVGALLLAACGAAALQAPTAEPATSAPPPAQPQLTTPMATESQMQMPEATEAPDTEMATPEASEAPKTENEMETPEATEAPKSETEIKTPEAPSTGGQGEFEIKTEENPTLGNLLTDDNKMTLYIFKSDKPGSSSCTGTCAQNWPPVTVPQGMSLKGDHDLTGALGTIQRPDGSSQVTYNGMPLYRFNGDTQPGDAKGQGIGNVWFVVPVNQ